LHDGKEPHEIRPCRYRGNPKYERCSVAECSETPVAKGFCYTHYYVLYKHGVDPDKFNEALKSQGGVCAICGGNEPRKGARLALDHCHKTGIFRGALCSNCNMGLGKFFDRIDLLEKAAEYLKNFIVSAEVA